MGRRINRGKRIENSGNEGNFYINEKNGICKAANGKTS
jgi:hypothetical protein